MDLEPIFPPFCDGVNLSLKELLYYKNQSLPLLPPAKSVWAQLAGMHATNQLGRGMDFSEVRAYQPGDDVRTIDWRVTARTGKTHTKLYTEEKEQVRLLFIDLSTSMYFGSKLLLKSIQATHLAALLTWLSISEQDRIGALILVGDKLIQVRPNGRDKGALAVLDALVQAHHYLQHLWENKAKPHGDYVKALRHLNRLCPKGSELIFISDFYALLGDQLDLNGEKEDRMLAQKQRLITQLCSHNHPRFMSIYDPLEQGETAYKGSEYVTDHKRSAWIDFSRENNKEAIAQAFSQRTHCVEQLAMQFNIPFYQISAGIPLIHQLGFQSHQDI